MIVDAYQGVDEHFEGDLHLIPISLERTGYLNFRNNMPEWRGRNGLYSSSRVGSVGVVDGIAFGAWSNNTILFEIPTNNYKQDGLTVRCLAHD